MKHMWRQTVYHLSLWLVAILFFLPVLWIILAAFKTKDDLLAIPPKWFFSPTLANFQDLVSRHDFYPSLRNSFLISTLAVIVAIVVSFLAAYSFSRFRPKGTNLLMFILLSIRMVPAAASVVPVFLMYIAFGWKDNFWGVMLFYAMFSIPFSVWILKGFIDGVSPRFDETGLVNGGSRLHVLFRVVLPQVRPGLIAAFIFNLIFVWNEFLFNFIIGGKRTTMIPVTLVTNSLAQGGVDWTYIAALASVYLVPPVLAIYFFQKYLLVGMTFGTVRGEV
ncbi:ABC transporter permease subunit [candidate division KSB3 bacterium]|uniref:ABC transporter permease subunit n=1 Tax=candidate division KSB3 bacterium TaxID=2044937 RepID=A0A9D5JV18_9BACT|nr:ABC transporter permease subunit [candidate division KSB3 bacterium]MBD3324803.1 ABC transporter permease subunit [candidate division KSB3 bacterium]